MNKVDVVVAILTRNILSGVNTYCVCTRLFVCPGLLVGGQFCGFGGTVLAPVHAFSAASQCL